MFDKASPSWPATAYAIGMVIALLFIVVPMVAKTITGK